MVSPPTTRASRAHDPWYLQHPLRAKLVMTGSFLAVFGFHLGAGRADATILYVLPVALAALAFGLRLGTVSGALGVVLIVAGVAVTGEHLTVVGWISHVTPLLLLGVLAGVATDRIRDVRQAEHLAMELALMQRDNAEVNDAIVQGITAARWQLEAGHSERALETLDETSLVAQQMVSKVLGSTSPISHEIRRPHQVIRRSAGDGRG